MVTDLTTAKSKVGVHVCLTDSFSLCIVDGARGIEISYMEILIL